MIGWLAICNASCTSIRTNIYISYIINCWSGAQRYLILHALVFMPGFQTKSRGNFSFEVLLVFPGNYVCKGTISTILRGEIPQNFQNLRVGNRPSATKLAELALFFNNAAANRPEIVLKLLEMSETCFLTYVGLLHTCFPWELCL